MEPMRKLQYLRACLTDLVDAEKDPRKHDELDFLAVQLENTRREIVDLLRPPEPLPDPPTDWAKAAQTVQRKKDRDVRHAVRMAMDAAAADGPERRGTS